MVPLLSLSARSKRELFATTQVFKTRLSFLRNGPHFSVQHPYYMMLKVVLTALGIVEIGLRCFNFKLVAFHEEEFLHN